MVIIRLSRAGAKKRPFYRIVAIDSRKPREGRPLEFLGTYDPRKTSGGVHHKTDQMKAWVEKGAQLSPTVATLVKRHAKAQPAPAAPEPAVAGVS